MKKPVLIRTTVRLFPDQESEAASKPRAAIKGHVINRMLKKGLDPYRSCIETWGKALENGKKLSFLFNYGRTSEIGSYGVNR